MLPNYEGNTGPVTKIDCGVVTDVRPGKTDVIYLDPLFWCDADNFEWPNWCKVKAHARCCK